MQNKPTPEEYRKFIEKVENSTTYKVLMPLPKNGVSHSLLVGERYDSEVIYNAGYNIRQLVSDGYIKVHQELFPFQAEIVGQNVKSVLSKCPECGSIGTNMPLELKCGNCGYPKTITYYDAETIHNYIESQKLLE